MFVEHGQNVVEAQGQEEALQVRIYTSWDELAGIKTAWEQLLQHSIGPTIFSTAEWLGAWWNAYSHGKQLIALAFLNSSGELVGLAPFYREKIHGGIKRLRLVGDGTGDSDDLDLIFRSGQKEVCCRALIEWLASESAWDLCELNTLPADSPNVGPLLYGLKKQRWVPVMYKRPKSAVVLPGSWDSYLEQLPREHAKGIERYTRRLHRHYVARIFKCTEEEELAGYLEILFDLHQKRWNAQGVPGTFALPERKQFYSDFNRAFLRRGWLEFWLLELDGKIAAAQLAFRYGDTVYQLQEGLDPAHYSDRVGQVLRSHVIRQLIAEGVRRYDYLGGDEAHKRNWGAQPGSYTDVHIVAKSWSRAHLYVRARHGAYAAERWLRANAPSAYSLLRQLWHLRDAFPGYHSRHSNAKAQ